MGINSKYDSLNLSVSCTTAFKRAKQLIEIRKKSLNRIPEIQEFDNGNILVQFFNEWETDINQNKVREFENIGGVYSNKKIIAIYAEAGKLIDESSFGESKTFMVINGEINIDFTSEINNEITTVKTFQSIEIPEYLAFRVTAKRDTYLIMITE